MDLGGSHLCVRGDLLHAKRAITGTECDQAIIQGDDRRTQKHGATFRMKEQFADREYAYILWTAETAGNVYELGIDTFVVREGKIVAK
jgi:hypothetical protein